MSENGKIIYQERFLKRSGLFLILYLVVLSLLLYFSLLNILIGSIIIITLFVIMVVPSNRIWSFSVYDDKIELLKTFTSTPREALRLDQIKQVRFESGFFDWIFNHHSYIFIYPQDDVSLDSQKKDRIALVVTGFNRKARILKLLKFFKSKGLVVVIKTSSKKIKLETGLNNWNDS